MKLELITEKLFLQFQINKNKKNTKIMKKLLVLLFTFLTLIVNAQELTGCMGITFTDSKEKVKTIIQTKDGFEFYKETPTTLSYLNGWFAGHKCVGAVFHFHNNQVHTMTTLLEVEQEPKVMDMYYEIVSELQEKYAIEPEKSHYFRKPYYEGDGYTASAIKSGYADIVSLFKFTDGNVVSVSITESLSIKVVYQNTKLAEPAINSNNKEKNKDY